MTTFHYRLAGFILLSSMSSNVLAANTQSFINNVSGLGNAYAGATVALDDASIQYYNPAGLSFLDQQQLSFGTAIANATKTFRGTTLLKALSYNQSGTARANPLGILPFFYYALPINKKWAFGIGVSAFGGSGQIFSDNSILRYTSTKSMIGILNLSPSLAFKFNDKFAAGAGFDINYLLSSVNAMVPTGIPGTVPDAKSLSSASNYGWGWHGGLIYNALPGTRLGLAYRSQVNFNPNGTSTFVLNPGATLTTEFVTPNFTYNAATAPTTSIGLHQVINAKWSVLAGADYAQWSVVRTINFRNIAFPTGPVNNNLVLNFRNTWRFAGAANYRYTDKWLLRMGLSYDQDPTNHSVVSADGVPNTSGYLLGIGGRYQINPDMNVDMGFAYYFFNDLNINFNTTQFQQVGKFTINNAYVLGLQFTILV